MSTVSGFVIGVVCAATLTVFYGEQLGNSLGEAVTQYSSLRAPAPDVTAGSPAAVVQASAASAEVVSAEAVPAEVVSAQAEQSPPSGAPAQEPGPETRAAEGPGLEQYWADYAAQADVLQPAGEFPWRPCFQRAAASYELPESLLLAIASGESNFDPAARSDKDAVGLMQIRWPDTSRHLGVRREADLYDPCTNVDAGARYLAELAGKFDDNLHLAVAAYNYGPGRIAAGRVPEGALWYSQYIYQHLQRVLGRKHPATSELIRPVGSPGGGRQVLMRFNQSHRARDFLNYLRSQVPGLNLQQQSEALGQHDVVLLYQNETERLRALGSLTQSGVAFLQPRSTSKLSL